MVVEPVTLCIGLQPLATVIPMLGYLFVVARDQGAVASYADATWQLGVSRRVGTGDEREHRPEKQARTREPESQIQADGFKTKKGSHFWNTIVLVPCPDL